MLGAIVAVAGVPGFLIMGAPLIFLLPLVFPELNTIMIDEIHPLVWLATGGAMTGSIWSGQTAKKIASTARDLTLRSRSCNLGGT